MNQKIKYLVIGGHGFIGSHFCKRLNPKDYLVYDIQQPTGNPSPQLILNRKQGVNPSLIEIPDGIACEYLVHFGAFAGVRTHRPATDYFQNNCLDYLKLLQKVKADKLIYISSSSVLGNIESPYSISKKICEEITKTHSNWAIVRPFTVYGENSRPDMLITRCMLREKIMVNGDPKTIYRKYTYVEDLIDCILEAQDKPGIVNAVGAEEYSIQDVLDLFRNEYSIQEKSPLDFTELILDGARSYICHTTLESFAEQC